MTKERGKTAIILKTGSLTENYFRVCYWLQPLFSNWGFFYASFVDNLPELSMMYFLTDVGAAIE